MIRLREIKSSLLHLFFPHTCAGCGNDNLSLESALCLKCMYSLPETDFEKHPNNPVEKIFRGRLPVVSAAARFYFTKESLMQRLMHEFKYKGHKELGLQLGLLMGEQLRRSGRFASIDALIPLPLFPAKEKKRGYNQAAILCYGIQRSLQIPVWDHVITRTRHTDTQTKKGRMERWLNIEGKFLLRRPDMVSNKHILLVDDVITTGATLESCGAEMLKTENTRVSIATLCIASH